MKRLVCVLLLGAIALLPSVALAKAPMADQLPAGAVIYAGWAGGNEAWDESAAGEFFNGEFVASVLKSFRTSVAQQKAQGDHDAEPMLWSDAMDLAQLAMKHPLAAAGYSLDATGDGPMVNALMLIDLGDDKAAFQKKVAELMSSDGAPPLLEATSEGVKYQQVQGTPVAMGYRGNTFFLAVGPDGLKMALAGKPAKSLADDTRFATAFKAVAAQAVQGAYFLDAIALRKQLAEAEKAHPGGPSAQLEIALDALGLAKVETMVAAMAMDAKAMHIKLRIDSPAPHRGVLLPLAGKPIDDKTLAMLPADTKLALLLQASPAKLLEELRGVLNKLEPRAKDQLDDALMEISQATGMSIEEDLLPGLGDSWALYTAPSLGGLATGSTLSVSIANAEKFALARGKLEMLALHGSGSDLKRFAVGDDEGRYLAPNEGVAPAWIVRDGRLHVALWPQVLKELATAPDKKLTEAQGFQALRKKVAAKPSMLLYVDTPGIVEPLYGGLMAGWAALVEESRREQVELDTAALPTVSSLKKTFSPEITAISSDDEGITMETYGNVPVVGAWLTSMLASAPAATPAMVAARTSREQHYQRMQVRQAQFEFERMRAMQQANE